MSSQNVLQLVDTNTERSSLRQSVLNLSEEYVGSKKLECDLEEQCLSVNELPAESSNTLGVSKECKRKKSNLGLTEHELVSSEEQAGTLAKLSNNVGENYFSHLSDEIVLQIFKWVPKRSLNKLGLVCHQFNRIFQDRSLWTEMDVSSHTISGESFSKILRQGVITLAAYYSQIQGLSLPPSLSADFKAPLRYLDLGSAKISPSTLIELFNHCTQIKMLSLQRVPVNDEVLMALSANKDLEALNFSESSGITEKGLRPLLTNCRKIRELNLDWTSLSPTAVKCLCNNSPASLDKLSITACYNITHECVANLVRSCPNLRELDLSGYEFATPAIIHHLTNLKGLHFLSLTPQYGAELDFLLPLWTIDSLSYFNIDLVHPFRFHALESKMKINRRLPHSTARWNIWDWMVQDWSWS